MVTRLASPPSTCEVWWSLGFHNQLPHGQPWGACLLGSQEGLSSFFSEPLQSLRGAQTRFGVTSGNGLMWQEEWGPWLQSPFIW